MRGATYFNGLRHSHFFDFNPRAPCGARRIARCKSGRNLLISIHAPLAGRDGYFWRQYCDCCRRFQSTRPLRGATRFLEACRYGTSHFNPRAPCGARRSASSAVAEDYTGFQSTRPLRGATLCVVVAFAVEEISIHAPLAGRDTVRTNNSRFIFGFQSTRPLRGATANAFACVMRVLISIHAPLAGRDKYYGNV